MVGDGGEGELLLDEVIQQLIRRPFAVTVGGVEMQVDG
jgi:hypothetical protein